MPLHPAVATMLAQVKTSGRPALSAGTPEAARQMMAAMRAAYGMGSQQIRATALEIPTREGSIPARLLTPERPQGLVVYLHGGGWVIGGLDDFDAVPRTLAARSGCAVLLVDYRLAPEAPFPAAIDDAEDAVLWAAANVGALVGHTVPLVVAGDSAGGNLAAITATELRHRVTLALQVLIYPVTDGDFETLSYAAYSEVGLLTRQDMEWFFHLYAPHASRTEPRLYPAARTDLAGSPPALVLTAEYDVLRDEGERYARQLQQAGVATTLRRQDGLPHGFIRLHNLVDTADAALSDIAAAISRATALDSGSAKG